MTAKTRGRLRKLWLDIHLWLGVGLCLLSVPVGITGSVLVWHDQLETVTESQRYALTGDARGPSLATFADNAMERLGDGARITQIRLPAETGEPVVVVARPARATGPRDTVSAWMDPPTAAVLDVGPSTNAFMQLMHNFHGNLLVPQFSGRQIVGWVGVAMLILSLSGIYLWWPKRLSLVRALGWRKAMRPSANLHHLFGIWIAIPLAILSFTGMYISFPQTTRAIVGTFAEVSPPRARPPGGPGGPGGGNLPLTETRMGPDAVLLAAVLAGPAGALATGITLPTEQSPSWRVTLATDGGNATVSVEDATGEAKASLPPPVKSGDDLGRVMRRLHDGIGYGIVWQAVIFVGGLLPALFAVTGIMMWLRRRKANKALAAKRKAALAASAS
ncbi:PepSY-associated TM helix domain-containing protein [Zavarzinia aquatilis]|nr:PepSY-associated TM helix domain-containing protein [Zavarzinia aquatilis]